MENLLVYLVKASLLIAVFILSYKAFLRKETFFITNRWFLLAGLFTSILLPFVVYTQVVWVNPEPVPQMQQANLQQVLLMHQAQVLESAKPQHTINWFDVLVAMYITGVLFFLIRFVFDFLSLRRVIRGQAILKDGSYLLVDSPSIQSPFSFFNYIVYNSAVLEPQELESIISHEKVHSRQKHSLDMIISQLFCSLFWFSPFVWMYKRAISQNLEFIADAEATKLLEDKRAYQKTLLKITVQPQCIAITNHFYQSLIKKRIVMLNKKQSSKINSWKYGIVLPALVAFILIFQVQVIAQEKHSEAPGISIKSTRKIVVEVTKDSKDEELQSDKKMIKEEFGADVNFENIKRNQNKEITAIKVTVTDQGQSQQYEVSGSNPISPFTVEMQKGSSGRNAIRFGTGSGENRIMANAFVIEGNESDSIRFGDGKTMRIERIERNLPPTGTIMPPMGRSMAAGNVNIEGDNMLIVVDGVKKGKGEAAMKDINSMNIASITVLKGKEGKKKYGKDAKDGVIEIITRKSGDRIIMRNPQSFTMEVPEIGEHFNFNFDLPDFPDMQSFNFDFGNLEDFDGIFKDGELIMSENLTPEEREQIKAEMQQAREEIRKKLGRLEYNKMWEGTRENIQKDQAERREEMKRERMEMEKVRKELQEAKKELELARKNLNKKT